MPRKVLVLSLTQDGRQNPTLRAALGDKIQRSGALLVKDDGLSDEARRCDEPSCLRQLAQEFGADVLVAARMEHQSRFDQLLKLWMFDTTASRDFRRHAVCDSRIPEPCVTEYGGQLLSELLDGPSRPTRPPKRPSERPLALVAPAPAPPPSIASLPAWRLGLGVALSVVGAAGLATGAFFASEQSRKGGSYVQPCDIAGNNLCLLDFTKGIATAFTLGGISVATAALTFAWPRPRLPPTPKESPR